MGYKSIKMPENLIKAIEAEAERVDRTFHWVALKTLEKKFLKPEKKVKKSVPVVNKSETQKVMDEYCRIMGRKCKLTPKRQELINERLLDCGYNAIIQAIHGCTRSPYHMGQNPQKTAYNDIELICRSVEYIEKFNQTVGVIQNGNESSRNLSNAERAQEAARGILSGFELTMDQDGV